MADFLLSISFIMALGLILLLDEKQTKAYRRLARENDETTVYIQTLINWCLTLDASIEELQPDPISEENVSE